MIDEVEVVVGGAKACVVVTVDSDTSNTEAAAPNIAIMIAAILLCDCLPTGGGGGDFG